MPRVGEKGRYYFEGIIWARLFNIINDQRGEEWRKDVRITKGVTKSKGVVHTEGIARNIRNRQAQFRVKFIKSTDIHWTLSDSIFSLSSYFSLWARQLQIFDGWVFTDQVYRYQEATLAAGCLRTLDSLLRVSTSLPPSPSSCSSLQPGVIGV